MTSTATFSPDRLHRYTLWREWGGLTPTGKGFAMIIGLNPSTADETEDDPTIRRCIGFAKSWGYDALFTCLVTSNQFSGHKTRPAGFRPPPFSPRNHPAR